MTKENIIFLLSLISLIISSLTIIIGIISLYKLKKNYPNYQINWYKKVFLFTIWGLIFICNYGLLIGKNWGKFGLIMVLWIIFITLLIFIIFNILSFILLLFNKFSSLNHETSEIEINQEFLPENNNNNYHEDRDEINYNTPIFGEQKDLDELNIYDDEGEDDEIYYLDNLREENDTLSDNSPDFSFYSYQKQALLINIIMAFFANLLIFYFLSFLQS